MVFVFNNEEAISVQRPRRFEEIDETRGQVVMEDTRVHGHGGMKEGLKEDVRGERGGVVYNEHV